MYRELWNPKSQAVWENRDPPQPVMPETVGSGSYCRQKDEESSAQRRKYGPMNVRGPQRQGRRKSSGFAHFLLSQVDAGGSVLLTLSRGVSTRRSQSCSDKLVENHTVQTCLRRNSDFHVSYVHSQESHGFVGLDKSVVLPFCAQNDEQTQTSQQRHNNG